MIAIDLTLLFVIPVLTSANSSNAFSLAAECAKNKMGVISAGLEGVGTVLTPRQAVPRVAEVVRASSTALETIRVSTLLGSNPRTLGSVASALRCWGAFADDVLGAAGNHLPPSTAGIIAFSRIFRNPQTFSNYVSHIRLACQVANVSAGTTYGPEVRRATGAIRKREPHRLEKLFIESSLLRKLCRLSSSEGDHLSSALYSLSYMCLLRVRSEALTAVVGVESDIGQPMGDNRAVLIVKDDRLLLCLARRKNRSTMTTLERKCVCHLTKSTCTLHLLAPVLTSLTRGDPVFGRMSGDMALASLRRRLSDLSVPQAQRYRLHDFRRGHAQELATRGRGLATILRAGDWRSAAFSAYLDSTDIEAKAVLEVAMDMESEGD